MAAEVFTAPLALIKVGNVTVGKMRSLRVSENFRRGRVIGIGNIKPSEVPVLEFSGSLSCSFYTISYRNHQLTEAAIARGTDNVRDFVNTIVLREEGFSLVVLKKSKASEANNIVTPTYSTFAVIRNVFINADGFNLDETGISNRDSGFDFIDPIYYPQQQ